jgi:hypothetical protein
MVDESRGIASVVSLAFAPLNLGPGDRQRSASPTAAS